MSTKRIAVDGVLTAAALIIFIVEQLIPLPVPVPGIKLGLSNVITLFAFFAIGPADAFVILITRIFLGSVFAGNLSAVLYSLTGGLLCYIVTFLLSFIVNNKQIWVCGVFGAVFHNVGQITVAVFLTGTKEIAYYLPILIIAGIVTGLFTGLVAQFTYFCTEKLLSPLKTGKNKKKDKKENGEKK